MSDPQPPENLPARPPLPPQASPPAEPQADTGTPSPPSGQSPSETRAEHAEFPREAAASHSAPAYGQPQSPPPNPFGQRATTGRHAPQPSAPTGGGSEPEQFGFAPPSTPGFGAPRASDPGSYGSYPQAPTAPAGAQQQYSQQAPQYGQQQYGQQAPQYQQQYGQQAQQYPQPGYPQPGYPAPAPYGVDPAGERTKQPTSRLATTGLALGVIGVVGGIFFGWTLLLSVAAIVLGFRARSREPNARGVALGAIVTGIVGVLLSLGWLAYSILTWLALTAS